MNALRHHSDDEQHRHVTHAAWILVEAAAHANAVGTLSDFASEIASGVRARPAQFVIPAPLVVKAARRLVAISKCGDGSVSGVLLAAGVDDTLVPGYVKTRSGLVHVAIGSLLRCSGIYAPGAPLTDEPLTCFFCFKPRGCACVFVNFMKLENRAPRAVGSRRARR